MGRYTANDDDTQLKICPNKSIPFFSTEMCTTPNVECNPMVAFLYLAADVGFFCASHCCRHLAHACRRLFAAH